MTSKTSFFFFARNHFFHSIKKNLRAYAVWVYALFIATYLKYSNAGGVTPGMLEMETQPMNDHIILEK